MVPFGAMDVRELLIDTLAHIAPAGALEHLTPDEAERRVPGSTHSIAEIVAHMDFWASWFCSRCEGTPEPMVTSAATGWPAVAPNTWPERHRQFLSTLERAAALGAESRGVARAAVDEVYKRGLKITGHLCSVTYAEAADLGIDNLEHGFMAATDFVNDKQLAVCPGQGRRHQSLAALDENGEPFKALVKKLVDRRVALTSTLTVFAGSTWPASCGPRWLD